VCGLGSPPRVAVVLGRRLCRPEQRQHSVLVGTPALATAAAAAAIVSVHGDAFNAVGEGQHFVPSRPKCQFNSGAVLKTM
jgi:hypothetical protein